MLRAISNRILSGIEKRPFASQVAICGVKSVAADLLVQRYIEKRKEIDYWRLGAWSTFGLLYCGVAQWFLYIKVMSKCFPAIEAARPLTVVGQMCMDNFLFTPLFYYPSFYLCSEVIQSPTPSLYSALKRYKQNAWEDNTSMWAVWIFADLGIYGFLPLHLRLPANHAISLAWTCWLSFRRGNYDP